jgi:hypothetical protein
MRHIVKTNEETFLPVRLHLPGAMETRVFSHRTYYASRKHPEWAATDTIHFLTVTADMFGRET